MDGQIPATPQAGQERADDLPLEQVFEHRGDGVCVFDAALTLRSANPRVAEILCLPTHLLAPGTALERWLRFLAEAGHYGTSDIEAEVAWRLERLSGPEQQVVRRQRPDGRTIETRRTPLADGGFTMVCVDVTEHVASEVALFQNQRTLEVLLEGTEEGFWFIDNALCTTDANPAMCRMLGLTREALIGRTIWEFVDAENEAIFRAQVQRRDQGSANTYEITLTRADGGRVRCVNNATPIHDAQGRKIGAIGLFSDITAQRAAAEAAQRAMALAAEKSEVLAVTLDSLAQGVLGFDAGLRLHSWNRRAIELLELPTDLVEQRPTLMDIGQWQAEHGMLGTDLEYVEGEAMREIVRRHIGNKLSAGEEPRRYRRRRADGRVIEVQTHLGSDGGQVRTYTDVTAEVQAAEALLAAKEEAERANRAKSEFLSRMSHELRTPLNAILGFGQLMEQDPGSPLAARQTERLAQILAGGRHLLALINEVLDLSRIEAGALSVTSEPVDVDALADDCLRLLGPLAASRDVALLPRAGQAGVVRADAMRLRQVLLNLLSNAIKYNRPEGTVRLRCARTATFARIEVEDSGLGIDDAQQERVFRPFERLETSAGSVEGTGIGLALSRSLVMLMGGQIGVRSVEGEGSCFHVELPLAAQLPGESATPDGLQAAAAPTGRHRVLYIEDNAVNQLLMRGMFTHRPLLALQMADTPEQGLAMAAETPPDLVLLDLQLPGQDGYAVLRALRADPRTAHAPALAVSANALPEDLARAQAAGFEGYLTKPLDLGELLTEVDRWLAAGRASAAG